MEREYAQFFDVFIKVSKAIHTGGNTTEILERIVTHISDILSAKGCIFWIVDRGQKTIKNKISHGFSYRNLAEIDYETLMAIFDQQGKDCIHIEDATTDSRIPNLDKIGKKRVGSIHALFFEIVRDYHGILALYFRDTRALTPAEEEIVRALGEQGAIALQKSLSFDEKMLDTLRQIVEGFTLALEAKDEQTHGHSVRVANFAMSIARRMGLTDAQTETIYHGGLLHDIGKIGMNDQILERLGILNRKEMDIVRQHPLIGARITQPLVFLSDVEPLIRHHHERWDGTGYPDGLKGKDIPLGARILTVCDAFETMLAGRKHFAKMKLEDAIVNLQLGAASQFDPEIVLVLFDILEEQPEIAGATQASVSCIQIHKRRLKNNQARKSSSLFI
ncbi:MAG: HD domain-containing protein [Desulfocapsaceae bacterium]|nr:HD domain-containing protein [Desulfocapsaceae bacterium]